MDVFEAIHDRRSIPSTAPIPSIAHYWKGYLAPSPGTCSRSARPRRSRSWWTSAWRSNSRSPRRHRARRGGARRPGEGRRGRLRGGAAQPQHALRRPRADGRRRHARRRRARAAAPSLAGGRSPAALRGDLDKPRESSGGGGCGASRDHLRDRARRLRLTWTETTMATLKVQGPGWRSRQSAILTAPELEHEQETLYAATAMKLACGMLGARGGPSWRPPIDRGAQRVHAVSPWASRIPSWLRPKFAA